MASSVASRHAVHDATVSGPSPPPSLAPSAATTTTNSPTSTHTSSALSTLPTELLDALLDTLPASDLQRTTQALMAAFPALPISKAHLYRHLVIGRRPGDGGAESEDVALKRMWLDLQADKDENGAQMIGVVRSFTMESWRGDADIMNKWVGGAAVGPVCLAADTNPSPAASSA